jgi:hypothetical protein
VSFCPCSVNERWRGSSRWISAVASSQGDHRARLVQQSHCQVLLSDLGAARKHDVFAAGGLPCLFERGLDSVGDEVERGPSLHLHRITRVMGEDEHGVVVGRIVAPPARPLLVARGTTADRAEHVPAHHPGADVLDRFLGLSVCSRSPRPPACRGIGARRPAEPPSRGAARRPRRAGSPRSDSGRRRTRPFASLERRGSGVALPVIVAGLSIRAAARNWPEPPRLAGVRSRASEPRTDLRRRAGAAAARRPLRRGGERALGRAAPGAPRSRPCATTWSARASRRSAPGPPPTRWRRP